MVKANIAAMESEKAIGETINIGTGKNYSVNEVADLVTGDGNRIWKVNLPPRPGEAQVTLADISKAEKLLGYKPTVSLPDWIKSQL